MPDNVEGPGFTMADEPPAESDDEAFARLAKLSALDYDRCRNAEADRRGCRVGTLDQQVEAARRKAQPATDRAVTLHNPEPWPDPVATSVVLDELAAALKRHLILSDSAASASALWIAHTWVADRFDHTPRLGITSPTKRCGKSTFLEVLRLTCRRSIKADNISASGVFRTVEQLRPVTLFIDEADSFLRENEELRGVLNSGYERSGSVIRVVEINGEHQAVQFATFAPCALAAIGDLPSTLADRAIPIRMERKAAGETVQRLRQGRNRDDLSDLARKLARWAADTGPSLSNEPTIPEGMGDREGDISTPLLAIADHAGAIWAARGRRALLDLFGVQATEESAEESTLLLSDLRVLFNGKGDEMPTKDILAALGDMEDRRYAEWKAGKPITATQLSRALRPFRVRPTTYRPQGGATVKGYLKTAFAEAWNRYLPAESPTASAKGGTEPKHGNNAVQDSDFPEQAPVTPNGLLPHEISDILCSGQQCYRVTGQIPLDGRSGIEEAKAEDAMGETEGEL